MPAEAPSMPYLPDDQAFDAFGLQPKSIKMEFGWKTRCIAGFPKVRAMHSHFPALPIMEKCDAISDPADADRMHQSRIEAVPAIQNQLKKRSRGFKYDFFALSFDTA
jgi:hypothetical protein